ncbi:hypothetical protein MD484_g5555, partial [Candolleomyces efflorescens]
MSFAKCLVLALSLVASVNALATPHAIRHSVHHRSIAARAAEPRSVEAPVVNVAARAPSNRKRCRARPTSSSSIAVTQTSAPINAAPIPTDDAPSTSSTRAAEPTTTRAPQPSTTTRAAPTTTSTRTTTQPPATTSSSGGGGSAPGGFLAGTQSGQGTFYDTGLGACGRTNRDTDLIAAVSMHMFDNYPGYNGVNPNNNPICGKKIKASRGGASVTITVVDRCVGCALTDLDFSPTAFDALTAGNRGLGRVQITWEWA